MLCSYCSALLNKFQKSPFEALSINNVPSSPGIYILYVIDEPANPSKTISDAVSKLDSFPLLKENLTANYKLELLKRVPARKCDVIYIGSTENIKRRLLALTFGKDPTYLVHVQMVNVLLLTLAGFKLGFAFAKVSGLERIVSKFRNRFEGYKKPERMALNCVEVALLSEYKTVMESFRRLTGNSQTAL